MLCISPFCCIRVTYLFLIFLPDVVFLFKELPRGEWNMAKTKDSFVSL